MKQVLVGAVLLITAAIGISAPPQVAAEHAESPPGAERVVATRLANGHSNACIILDNEQVRCWGSSAGTGVPGSGNIGDDETPDSVRTVDVGPGRTVKAVEGGSNFTCVLLDNGDVRCWGYQTFGPVLGSPESGGQRIGDGEEPTTIAPISLGGKATAIASGNFSSCAILEDGSVRCWGDNRYGQLGYGNTVDVGDVETPAQAGAVDLGAGRTATAITVGRYQACAILDGGDVRCWGKADSMPGLAENIGDDELPSAAPVVDFGGKKALAISAGSAATCALVDGGVTSLVKRGLDECRGRDGVPDEDRLPTEAAGGVEMVGRQVGL
jgi:alpha-tubulin suppressor-like RCC1 family protein